MASEDAAVHNAKYSSGLDAILWLNICGRKELAGLSSVCPLRDESIGPQQASHGLLLMLLA